MKTKTLYVLFMLFVIVGCNTKNEKVINVYNNSDVVRTDEIIEIDISELSEFNADRISANVDGVEVPSQFIDNNGDGENDSFLFLVNLSANDKKSVVIKENKNKKEFPQRAHAEISEKRDYKIVDGVYTDGHFVSVKRSATPPNHIDHNYYYKMEGPAWESDKVGYRIYLDWRNSTDIFGKKVSDIVLPKVGHTKDEKGHDTYHAMDDWGMDIFKVGNSLGIGTFGAFVDGKVEKVSKTDSTICVIENDGPIVASLDINYYGWNIGSEKIDLSSSLQINAGSRLTHCKFIVDSRHSEFCTGLAKHENTEYMKSDNKSLNAWNYIALWGKQSLAGPEENVGIALFYNNKQLLKLTEDKLSYIVVLNPTGKEIDYYFSACWEQEINGIKNINEFKKYLNKTISELNNPVKVK